MLVKCPCVTGLAWGLEGSRVGKENVRFIAVKETDQARKLEHSLWAVTLVAVFVYLDLPEFDVLVFRAPSGVEPCVRE